jgi:hypothetical protein
MKTVLLLILIAFCQSQQQPTQERKDPDLSVLRFGWARHRPNSNLIRGAQRPGGNITPPLTAEDRDLETRKGDLRNNEKKAAGSALPEGNYTYQIQLELKNTGANVVKYLIWEFRPTGMPDDYEPKQYLCKLQVKPNGKKVLELWTPFAPVKVVRADLRADALKDGEVIINKIEYADGTVWKKPEWNFLLPPHSEQGLEEGKCSVF